MLSIKKLALSLALLPALLAAVLVPALGQEPTLTTDAAQPVAKVSPLHYGLMTEEINHSYDGGLYAELVQNRAFLDNAQTPMHWSVVSTTGSAAAIALDQKEPLNSVLSTSLRVDVSSASRTAPAGVANDGYWGIPVKPVTSYHASFFAKAAPGFSGPVVLAIESDNGAITYAKVIVPRLTDSWQSYSVTLKTGSATPTSKARFALTLDRPGTVWFSLVSLFPPTWKNQPNGFRPDLMQMLVDLKPAFLRLPGGNYLEGNTIATRFEWKKTIGPLSQRPGHFGPWGYRSTDGLGFLELLLWCEDMQAEPVLGIYAGYSLGGEHVKSGPDLEPYVQDALDEIEYVSGPVTTKWGAERAKDGHSLPFKLHYVEIGNEDGFDKSNSYDARFTQFYDALKAKYPGLKIISTIGSGDSVEKRVISRRPDVFDKHFYSLADDFLHMAPNQFDNQDRKGASIFVGEWAAHEDVAPWDERSQKLPPTPSMKAALGDAAWMVGMERNADLVIMQCYAPLLVNVNSGGRQWRPDLIGYDALRTVGSPSYYAQRMFSQNHGDAILKATLTGAPLLSSVTRDSKSGVIFIKYVNPQAASQEVSISLNGIHSVQPIGTAIQLSADPSGTNSIDAPTKVVPITRQINGIKPLFDYTFSPFSVTVLRLGTR